MKVASSRSAWANLLRRYIGAKEKAVRLGSRTAFFVVCGLCRDMASCAGMMQAVLRWCGRVYCGGAAGCIVWAWQAVQVWQAVLRWCGRVYCVGVR